MMQAALLALWMSTGACGVLVGPPVGESHAARLPIAAILGPLWWAVRSELPTPEPAFGVSS